MDPGIWLTPAEAIQFIQLRTETVFDTYKGFALYDDDVVRGLNDSNPRRRFSNMSSRARRFRLTISNLDYTKTLWIVKVFDPATQWLWTDHRGMLCQRMKCSWSCNTRPQEVHIPYGNNRFVVPTSEGWRSCAKGIFRNIVNTAIGRMRTLVHRGPSRFGRKRSTVTSFADAQHTDVCVIDRRRIVMRWADRFCTQFLGNRYTCIRLAFDYLKVEELCVLLDFRNYPNGSGLSGRALVQRTLCGDVPRPIQRRGRSRVKDSFKQTKLKF